MALDVVDLAMAAVTGEHQHLGTDGANLFHFPSTVIDALLVVSVCQSPSPAAAADLMHSAGMQINPVGHTLIQYPSGFFEKTVPKSLLGPAAVIARVMVGRPLIETVAVQFNAPGLDIVYEQIEHGNGFKLFQGFREPFLQTIPGCQIGMPSFRPQQGLDFQAPHIFNDASCHNLHGIVVTGKISPGGSLPIV